MIQIGKEHESINGRNLVKDSRMIGGLVGD